MSGYIENRNSSDRLVAFGVFALLMLAIGSFVFPGVASGSAIEYVAFVVGGLGLGISVVGFAFTIAQLWKTQEAAEAATTAIEKIKQDFGSLDAVSELQATRSSIEAAQDSLRLSDWPRGLVQYNRMRESLNRVAALSGQLQEDELENVREALAHVHRGCVELNAAGSAGGDYSGAELSERLTELDSFIVQVETKIRGRFGVQ